MELNSIGETVKLQENPASEVLVFDTRHLSDEECLSMFEKLPKLLIPPEIIINNSDKVCVEIYKLTCSESGKSYVGQTVSHVLNYGVYRRFGSEKRFYGHISETFSSKHNQSHYLNNAIRKYGAKTFSIEILAVCKKDRADFFEDLCIRCHNTLCPNGYNLRTGGRRFRHTSESMLRVATGVRNFFEPEKKQRFFDIFIDKSVDPNTVLRKLNRSGKQYGWYILISGKKADFGGVSESLDDSKQRAIDFVKYLQDKSQT